MACNLFYRSYFYLTPDGENIGSVLEKLKKIGFQPYSRSDHEIGNTNIPSEQKRYYQFKQDKINILIIQIISDKLSLEDMRAYIIEMEQDHWLGEDDLVGMCDIYASSVPTWEHLQTQVEIISKRKAEHHFDLEGNQLARSFSPRGYSCYACRVVNLDKNLIRLLGFGLPLIEARFIETNMISNLLRERMTVIHEELTEIDKKLSLILHSNLVNTGSLINQVEELEQQIQELSHSYGIIAGHSNVIDEGYQRLKELVYKLKLRLNESPLNINSDLIEVFCQPFNNRLETIANLQHRLENSRTSHQAAIEVVGSKIDIINSRTNIRTQEEIKDLMKMNTAIQKQSLVFQFAAGLIEFIVLAYYSHSLWKNLAHNAYESVPAAWQFLFVLLFSGITTYLTHIIAEYLQGEKHLKKKIIITAIPLVIIILITVVGSFMATAGSVH